MRIRPPPVRGAGPVHDPGRHLGLGRWASRGGGAGVTNLSVGDRVVVPFQIACGQCFMCQRGLQTQCEVTQVHERGCGAALFGYTKLYGRVPGAQAEYLRVPHAAYGAIKVPDGPPDDRFLLPQRRAPHRVAGRGLRGVGGRQHLAVLGLGPIGEMATRIAQHQGHRVIGVDLVPERLAPGEGPRGRGDRPRSHRRPGGRHPRPHRGARPRRRGRCGGHGGPRIPADRAAAQGDRAAAPQAGRRR